MTAMTTTRRVIYSGRVQGVGFRFLTRMISERYAVTGYVKNLPDGTVEMVAQGEAGEIDRFRQRIREEMGGLIRGEEDRPVDTAACYASFEIAY